MPICLSALLANRFGHAPTDPRHYRIPVSHLSTVKQRRSDAPLVAARTDARWWLARNALLRHVVGVAD
jgi:hypothetical protein